MAKARLGFEVKPLPPGWKPDKISPSAAGRWINCPGSIAATHGMEDSGSSAANDGTRAHKLLEAALLLDVKSDGVEWFDDIDGSNVDEQMRKAVALTISYVESWLAQHPGAYVEIEEQVSLHHHGVDKNLKGTGDILLMHRDELCVTDFKYGRVTVRAERNKQMMLYALGKLNKTYRPKRVRLTIVQPRGKGNNPVDEWLTTPAELEDWFRSTVKPVVIQINTMGAKTPRKAGDWCQYCRARGACPEMISMVFKSVGLDRSKVV